MAIEPRNILKTFFETGDIPTQDQFTDVLDSYVHKTDDGVTIYVDPGTGAKSFGINNTHPEAALGITADGANKVAAFNKSGEDDATWFMSLTPDGELGFSIDQLLISGLSSRFFISELNGFVGIGNTSPNQKLDIQESTTGGVTAVRISNTATIANNGWGLGHEQNADTDVNGSFTIFENNFTDAHKRLNIRSGGNVGINELIPDTLLHVSRDPANAATDLDLVEGTGIVTIGPITDNIVADYRGIQARHGEYIDTVLELTATTLNLQRVGGDILIHGDDAIDLSAKGIITADGAFGLGTITPLERAEIAGAIKIGTTDGTNAGTIRFSGTDFEGYIGESWVSLTSTGEPDVWQHSVSHAYDGIFYNADLNTRVGIGTSFPGSTLDLLDIETVSGANVAVNIQTQADTTSSSPADNRVAVQIQSTGIWGTGTAKDIGLFVSQVQGAEESENNLAAVLGGNVLIGLPDPDLTVVGTGGQYVLAIQTGGAPPSTAGHAAVQIYSLDTGTGLPTPTLHVLNGNGDLMIFYKTDGLTEADDSTIPDTYDPTTVAVIDNMRSRINQLEARLMDLGLLAEPT